MIQILLNLANPLTLSLLSVSDVVRMVTKSEIPPHTHILEIYASFAEDEDCEDVPPIRYLLQ